MSRLVVPALAAVMLSTLPAAAKTPTPKPAAPLPAAAAQAPGADEESEEAPPEKLPLGMTAGPAKVQLGSNAELQVPEGSIHGDAKNTKEMLERSGNLTSGQEVGMLLNGNGESEIIFEFDPSGYVKDDDKDELDADKMLKSLRENQEEANKELVRLGRSELELTRWQVTPHYDEATHNMEWAPVVRNKESGHESVNYNVRLLGRRGVMEVTLLVAPEKMEAQMPWFRDVLKNYKYVAGEDYAAWRKGDKVAEYGLAALVTGGAVAAGFKFGIFAKLWKFILAGLAALGAGLKRLFGGGAKVSSPTATAGDDRAGPPSE
jgi:uncharacterized membrane-anchored protein